MLESASPIQTHQYTTTPERFFIVVPVDQPIYIYVQVVGAFTGDIRLIDDASITSLYRALDLGAGTDAIGITAPGLYRFKCDGGCLQPNLRTFALSAGTPTIYVFCTPRNV